MFCKELQVGWFTVLPLLSGVEMRPYNGKLPASRSPSSSRTPTMYHYITSHVLAPSLCSPLDCRYSSDPSLPLSVLSPLSLSPILRENEPIRPKGYSGEIFNCCIIVRSTAIRRYPSRFQSISTCKSTLRIRKDALC